MLRLIRQLFHPNARNRRFFAAACGAFLLAVTALSSLLVVAEADHDCGGGDCATCVEVQECLSTFQLLGSGSSVGGRIAVAVQSSQDFVCPSRVSHAPATTLQSLFVRLDE